LGQEEDWTSDNFSFYTARLLAKKLMDIAIESNRFRPSSFNLLMLGNHGVTPSKLIGRHRLTISSQMTKTVTEYISEYKEKVLKQINK